MERIFLHQWPIKGEVGISSKTMWAAIIGAVSRGRKGWEFDVPHDPDDFRRCLLFVKQCGIVPEQLAIVKQVFPWFAPQIDHWELLVRLWEIESPSGSCPELYACLKQLEEQSYALAGFKSNGKGTWIEQ